MLVIKRDVRGMAWGRQSPAGASAILGGLARLKTPVFLLVLASHHAEGWRQNWMQTGFAPKWPLSKIPAGPYGSTAA